MSILISIFQAQIQKISGEMTTTFHNRTDKMKDLLSKKSPG
jgi:hypothetical protein